MEKGQKVIGRRALRDQHQTVWRAFHDALPGCGPSHQWTRPFQCTLMKCGKNHGYKLGEMDPALKTVLFQLGFYCLRHCYLLYSLTSSYRGIHPFSHSQSDDFSVSRDYSVSSSGDATVKRAGEACLWEQKPTVCRATQTTAKRSEKSHCGHRLTSSLYPWATCTGEEGHRRRTERRWVRQ